LPCVDQNVDQSILDASFLANRSQIGPLGERVMYQPSEAEFAEAMEILVACGAVRQVRS